MMKLAKVIAEIEGPLSRVHRAGLECLIAARLEPVRAALDRAAHRFEYLYHGGDTECNGIVTLVGARDCREALALFKEE